jgi:beta-N-acetylhexosaminidase
VTPVAPSNLTTDAWVEQTLRSLTLREKVGQMLVPRISGAYLAVGSADYQRLRDWVVNQGIGGVIITQGPPLEMAAKLNMLQEMAKVPILVTADMEHGPGQILQTGYILPYGIDNGSATRFPPLMGIGATRDERFAYALGKITALEGRSVGVHLNFGPVVDVNNNPNNPIINTRSYGEDPDLVAKMASANVRGLQENGMLSTAKHFPGHGDTGTDSHIQLPIITATPARTDTVELPPYRNAINAGVSAIMSAHIAFPALTGDSIPATLNPKILTGLLRDSLHFQGMIVTDAMDMGAIVANYGRTHASVLAVRAGADALLQPLPNDVAAIIDAVTSAVQSGELTEARIDQSVRKLLKAKAGLGLYKQRTVDIAKISSTLATPEHLAIADTAAERSITAVRNRDNLLPLTGGRVLSIVYADDYDPFTGRSFQAGLTASLPGLRTKLIDRNVTQPALDSLFNSIEPGTVVLFSPFIRVTAAKGGVALPDPIAAFVRRVTSAHKLVLTTFGNPYVLAQVPEVGTYVIAWGQWDVLQRAAARALTGQVAITGRLPIAIPPLHQLGEGIQIPARSGGSRE